MDSSIETIGLIQKSAYDVGYKEGYRMGKIDGIKEGLNRAEKAFDKAFKPKEQDDKNQNDL